MITTMPRFFVREIDRINRDLLLLSGKVEENLRLAVQAIDKGDTDLAEKVIEADKEIDDMEVGIEEECLKILALHQPVAGDLRFIVAVLKINNDLERIGDLASSIAQRVHYLKKILLLPVPFDLHGMTARVQWMLQKTLDAFVHQDIELALKVLKEDDEVDEIHRKCYKHVENLLRDENATQGFQKVIRWLAVSRALERIADHTTNIAEDVIYMLSGQIIRHQHIENTPDEEDDDETITDSHDS